MIDAIEAQVYAALLAIDGSLNDAEVLTAVALFGYTQNKLLAQKAEVEALQALIASQKKEYGEQEEATQKFMQAWAEAQKGYMQSLTVARVALKREPQARTSLYLEGERKRSFSGWFEQAHGFYLNLLGTPAFLAKMAEFGRTLAILQAEQGLVQAAHLANVAQEKEKGEAQGATAVRDAKLDEINEWLSDYKTIAQMALADNPQKLENLGFGPA